MACVVVVAAAHHGIVESVIRADACVHRVLHARAPLRSGIVLVISLG